MKEIFDYIKNEGYDTQIRCLVWELEYQARKNGDKEIEIKAAELRMILALREKEANTKGEK